MPDPSPLSWTHAAPSDARLRARTPWTFALVVVVGYALATLPILLHHHFDASAFIMAGDHHVDATHLLSPIIVQQDSNGYDGQFFYRMALSPFQLQPTAFGIEFDNPAYRTQRIFYPLLVWLATFGHAAAVPIALYLVNITGLATIAVCATHLTTRLGLAVMTPVAIVLWPGLFIALSHDTSEIVAIALLLAALDAYFAKHLLAYGVLGALATLARQTTLPVLAGIACYEAIQAFRATGATARWHRVLFCGMALVAFPAWQAVLHLVWGYTPRGGENLLGWPLLGAVTMLRDTLTGTKHFVQAHRPALDAAMRVYVLESAGWLLAFCVIVGARVPAIVRIANTGALAAGWLPAVVLMSMMAANGGWVDRTGYFRAFTECYVVGCLVLTVRPVPRWLTWLIVAGGALAFLGAWVLAIFEK